MKKGVILGLKTNSTTAEIWVDGVKNEWEARREMAQKLLGKIVELLPENDIGQIGGVVIYTDGGSFTGLRIGVTIANTLADALVVPVVGESGENWYEKGAKRLENGENDERVLPDYGRGVNITEPKK